MKTTIVIPLYNGKEWIADAVESALSQTVRCEVIVVNDGSTDGGEQVLKDYPVKLVHQVNKGLSSARNTGIMNATTEYILFLDADDMLLENCVEELEKIADTTKADSVAPSFREFGLGNANVILMPAPTFQDFQKGNRVGYCQLFRRSTLCELGGYSPRMVHGYEDYHLSFNLLKRGKIIVTTPEVLWLYRIRENSMIHTANQHREELMKQIEKDFYD